MENQYKNFKRYQLIILKRALIHEVKRARIENENTKDDSFTKKFQEDNYLNAMKELNLIDKAIKTLDK